jgi:hypothetical protein
MFRMTGSRSQGKRVRTKHTTDKEANMRLDLYTKAILTVIACCLLYLCFVSRPQIVHAQGGQQHVIIDGADREALLQVVISGVREDTYHPFAFPVIAAEHNPIPVDITTIGGQGIASGSIPVANTIYAGNGNPIPLAVTVK